MALIGTRNFRWNGERAGMAWHLHGDFSFDMGFGDPVTAFKTPHTNNQQISPCHIMKIFAFLTIVAFAEALTPAQ